MLSRVSAPRGEGLRLVFIQWGRRSRASRGRAPPHPPHARTCARRCSPWSTSSGGCRGPPRWSSSWRSWRRHRRGLARASTSPSGGTAWPTASRPCRRGAGGRRSPAPWWPPCRRSTSPLVLFFGVASGFCEWRLGTRRTAVACVVGQLVSVLGSIGIVALASAAGSDWGQGAGRRQLRRVLGRGHVRPRRRGRHAEGPLAGPGPRRQHQPQRHHPGLGRPVLGPQPRHRHRRRPAHRRCRRPAASSPAAAGCRATRCASWRRPSSSSSPLAQVLAMVFPQDGPLGPERDVVGRPLIILFVVAELLVAAGPAPRQPARVERRHWPWPSPASPPRSPCDRCRAGSPPPWSSSRC